MPPKKESSAIQSIRWLPPATLEITFKTGHIHRYDGVSAREYALLMAAPSKGEYFNREIRGKYPSKKIGKVKGQR